MADKITILIIDDEIISRYTLGALLDSLLSSNEFNSPEYTLVSAESGREGLQKAQNLIPDLILLDVMMPGMNGFETCRKLRADPNLATVPVVMITAWDEPTGHVRCLEAGANAVICKPFEKKTLKNLLETLVKVLSAS